MHCLFDRMRYTAATCSFLMIVFATISASAQRYSLNSHGEFGLTPTDGWRNTSPHIKMNSTDDAYSVRFTAMEDVTVDRVWQYLVRVDPGTTITVGIMGDSGGVPDGTYLSSATVDPGNGNTIAPVTFGSVSLNSGNVYHVVTQPAAMGAGEEFQIYAGNGSNAIRPYDRALDPMMSNVTRLDSGAWSVSSRDPYFFFGNGSDTTFAAGPGQPYHGLYGSGVASRGGHVADAGQAFTITTAEIPAESSVKTRRIYFYQHSRGNPTADLLVRLRETDGTILGTARVPAADATGVWAWLDFDQRVELLPEVQYLLTTEFDGPSTTSHYYDLAAYRTNAIAGSGAAGWGGTTASMPIVNAGGDDWSSWSPGNTDFDIAFTLPGFVSLIPEPASILLLGLGALFAFRRHRR